MSPIPAPANTGPTWPYLAVPRKLTPFEGTIYALTCSKAVPLPPEPGALKPSPELTPGTKAPAAADDRSLASRG